MEPKRVKDSSITVVQQMVQTDANLAGNVHGGVIMKLIDNTAGIVCARHSGGNAVTASIDRIDFHSPVFVGDILKVSASINFAGNTSMEAGVRIEAENVVTGEVRHTGSAYLTFVALDDNHHPKRIPPVIYETEDEKRRNCEARERRRLRLELRRNELNKSCSIK